MASGTQPTTGTAAVEAEVSDLPILGDPADHPRPQLTRPFWQDLSGTWQLAFDDAVVGITEHWQSRDDVFDRTIVVPYPFESEASGIGDTGFHPVIWYRRTFQAQVGADRRLILHFGAVDYRAQVWVNGRAVAFHEGGSTPFSADITSVLESSGDQIVVVRVEDQPQDLRQPRGKQDWQREPHAIWYARTSGIWQTVWLEDVPVVRVQSVRWRPDVDRRSLDLTVRLRLDSRSGLRLRVVLRRDLRVLADDTYRVEHPDLERRITLAENDMSLGHSELLWSPDQPHLIDATLTLLDDDGPVDEVRSYTALRSMTAARDRLLLNGRPFYLRMVLAQNFWPESHLAAPSLAVLRREAELVKELGFNGVRLHQKVEDPRFLAWCDRIGLLVWAELPAAYEFSTTTSERLTKEWLEVIDRDLSHPCIIAWVPFNESWGVPALERSRQQEDLVRALYHLTKAMDPDRLVIGNDGWEQPVSDLITVHDYTGSGAVLRERYGDRAALQYTLSHTQPAYRVVLLPSAALTEQPVIISEFGGIALDVDQTDSWRGYGSVRSPEELLAGYDELVTALLSSPVLAGYCWTQLTDVQQERNGLLTAARTPKASTEKIRSITGRVSAAVPGDAVNEFAYGDYLPAVTPAVLQGLGEPTSTDGAQPPS